MVADNDYNDVDGDGATGKEVKTTMMTTGDDNDDDGDGDDDNDVDGDGAMISGATGYDNDDDGDR